MLETGSLPLQPLRSRTYPLSAVREAIDALADRRQDESVICVNLDPTG